MRLPREARAAILEAAEDGFAEDGFEGAERVVAALIARLLAPPGRERPPPDG